MELNLSKASGATDLLSRLDKLEELFGANLDLGEIARCNEILVQIESSGVPKTSIRLSNLRALAMEGSDPEGAKQIYAECLQADPTHLSTRKRIIAMMLDDNKKKEAIDVLIEHLDTFSSDIESWALLHRLYLEQGMYLQGLYCVEEMLMHRANDPILFIRIAEIYYTLKKIDMACKYYCRAIEFDSHSAKAWWGLHLCCQREGIEAGLCEQLLELSRDKLKAMYKENGLVLALLEKAQCFQ